MRTVEMEVDATRWMIMSDGVDGVGFENRSSPGRECDLTRLVLLS